MIQIIHLSGIPTFDSFMLSSNVMDCFSKPISKSSICEHPKKMKKHQKFREDYKAVWPCLRASSNPNKEGCTHCNLCRIEFSVSHDIRDDCRHHVECKILYFQNSQHLIYLSYLEETSEFCVLF